MHPGLKCSFLEPSVEDLPPNHCMVLGNLCL